MFRYTSTVCRKCHLQEDPFHGITIDAQGLCTLCAKNDVPPPKDWDALGKLFEDLLLRVRGYLPYEGLIMLSGGKDSAYMAHLLKNSYGMNLLGFIIDINYEYPETFDNAKAIAHKLGIPYVIYRQDPELMRSYYRFLFCEESIRQEDCGQICTFCGRFLIRTAADFARAMGIPLVISGHNPDQILLMGQSIETAETHREFMEFTMELVAEDTAKAVAAWKRAHGPCALPLFPQKLAPDGVKLVFPYQHFPYSPEEMMRTVKEKLGWTPIKRFSKTYIASGCSLVKLWSYLAHCGNTNSYVDFEFSNQVRGGVLSLDTVQRFYADADTNCEELAALVRELDMVEDMRRLLRERAGEDNRLLRLLSAPTEN
ncbi:MAG: hypothetical protein R6W92_00320 [Desulfocurvibacter africanus]